MWAALNEIGLEGMRDRVTRHNSYARHLANLVRASPVLELLAPVTLSICCFRYVPTDIQGGAGSVQTLNSLNREILDQLHRESRHIPSSTEIDGQLAIRPCYINPRTRLSEVTELAKEVERIGAEAWAQLAPGD